MAHKVVSYIQVTRATASLTAYRTVKDWLNRYSHQRVVEKIDEKIAEKEQLIAKYAEMGDEE